MKRVRSQWQFVCCIASTTLAFLAVIGGTASLILAGVCGKVCAAACGCGHVGLSTLHRKYTSIDTFSPRCIQADAVSLPSLVPCRGFGLLYQPHVAYIEQALFRRCRVLYHIISQSLMPMMRGMKQKVQQQS